MSLLEVFSEMTTQRDRFGQNSCAADEQACVFSSFESNKHSVSMMFMINGQSFKLCNLQAYNFVKPSAKSNSFCMIVNMPVLGTVSNFQHSIFNTYRE